MSKRKNKSQSKEDEMDFFKINDNQKEDESSDDNTTENTSDEQDEGSENESEDDGTEDDDDDDNDDDDNDDDESNDDDEDKNETLFPQKSFLSQIKNKLKRRELYLKYKKEKKEEKKEARKKKLRLAQSLGDKAPPKQVPRTIESTREPDETMVEPDDEEVKVDEALDEMSSYFRKEKEPKVLITSSDNPHTKTIKFCRELKQTIPNAEFRWRNRSNVKTMVKAAIARDYTDIIIINEDGRKPNGMLLIHLPDGPTAHFKLTNVRCCREIKNRAIYSDHRPEVILNHFNTRLGHSIGRMFACLFHYDPEFKGRRVITFHNQRDYIFFRHHRYEFKDEAKVAIQEIGPRFTLKLRSLQKGTFDSKFGEFEWINKRHEMQTSRRRFYL